ncbi:MAG: hypothetical protein CL489_11455 [Acidobacteria bacterium]|jgi:hypothetical protein|nr:hypothetical protein [Acidobacteriota bacterium]MBF85068.1 hypothetical protein [Acidobacteriota bacterium]
MLARVRLLLATVHLASGAAFAAAETASGRGTHRIEPIAGQKALRLKAPKIYGRKKRERNCFLLWSQSEGPVSTADLEMKGSRPEYWLFSTLMRVV